MRLTRRAEAEAEAGARRLARRWAVAEAGWSLAVCQPLEASLGRKSSLGWDAFRFVFQVEMPARPDGTQICSHRLVWPRTEDTAGRGRGHRFVSASSSVSRAALKFPMPDEEQDEGTTRRGPKKARPLVSSSRCSDRSQGRTSRPAAGSFCLPGCCPIATNATCNNGPLGKKATMEHLSIQPHRA